MLNPKQLSTFLSTAKLGSSLNGELFVSSADGAFDVLLALGLLELVFAAARLVVTIVVESLLSEDAARLGIIVSVTVDICVVVCPSESVVVYVLIPLTSPMKVDVSVVVRPSESVVVYVLVAASLEIEVTVEPDPDNVVVCHSVTG